jgi:hypothetical protein
MNRFLLFPAVFFWFNSSLAQNFYVATNGNDANNGTINAPWKTIQKAVNTVTAGGTIQIRGGVYPEKINVAKSGNSTSGFITIQNYNWESVTVDASGIPGNSDNIFYLYNRNYVRIKGLELRNCVVPDNHDGAAIFIEGKGDHLEVLNCIIHDITGKNAMGITVYGTNKNNAVQNLLIDGNEIFDCEPAPSEALTLNGNVRLFQVTNNVVHDVNNIGIDMIGGEGTCPKAANDNARNGLCSGNTVYRARSNYGGGYAAGIYIDGGDTIIVERNEVHDCDLGMEIGCENKGKVATMNIIRNNLLYHNDKRGLSFGGYDYPATGKVKDCKFYNNTCYLNDVLNVDEGELYIEYANNCEVKNNVFYGSGTSYLMNFYFTNTTGNTFDYNCWYVNSGSAKFVYDGTQYNSLNSYKNNSGQDGHAINNDPQFIDVINEDFHLAATSSCIDAADPAIVPLSFELDFYGGSRISGSFVDIGADEFDQEERVALYNNQLLHVSVYPSIANDVVHLLFTLDEVQTVQVHIFDLNGISRKSLTVQLPAGKCDQSLSISKLEPGFYLVELTIGARSFHQKIIVAR